MLRQVLTRLRILSHGYLNVKAIIAPQPCERRYNLPVAICHRVGSRGKLMPPVKQRGLRSSTCCQPQRARSVEAAWQVRLTASTIRRATIFMANRRSMLGVLLAIALLASSASASLAQPAVAPRRSAAAAPGSMLMVENAGQWPAAARFQVWNSPLGAGTTWLTEDAIWMCGRKWQVARCRSGGALLTYSA